MIPHGATLLGPRAATPMCWTVLGLALGAWGLVFLAVQIGRAVLAMVVGL